MSPPVILSALELLKVLDEPRRVDELTPYLKPLPQQLFEPNSQSGTFNLASQSSTITSFSTIPTNSMPCPPS